MKKIIFILVDSLMPEILKKGYQSSCIPALQFLKNNGSYRHDCVTVFPTMTASIDASLITGSYPNEHKIPGLIWYDYQNQQMINYINGASCVRKLGIKNCAQNVLVNLNERHLSKDVKTIFEELADRGLTSASINLIIHRGYNEHSISLPIKKHLGIEENQKISGPELLFLGSMVYPEYLKDEIQHFSNGIRHSIGINDSFAVSAACKLINRGEQPDFMMVYLPDNDHRLHRIGPEKGELSLIKVDREIERLLNAFGSWEKAIQDNIIIVTSDHGQTSIGKEKEYNVDLDNLLHNYHVLQLKDKVNENHQLVICNNERMAHIYPLKEEIQEDIIRHLKNESRIDLIAWKNDETIMVSPGGNMDRNVMFSKSGPYFDSYGQSWNIEGDISILDLHVNNMHISYQDYPDVLARLYGVLFSQDCPLIVITARPRYEFTSKYYPKHNNGGSHGSLHKTDSLIPLIVAGDVEKQLPVPKRIVELKDYILKLFE